MPRYPPFQVSLQGQLRIHFLCGVALQGNSAWIGHAELLTSYAEIPSTQFSHPKKFAISNYTVKFTPY